MKPPSPRGESDSRGEASLVELRSNGRRIGLFARAPIAAGTVIMPLAGPLRSQPTQYSIQLDDHVHLDAGGRIDDELNHSCDASARMDLDTMNLVAKRPIAPGQEVTINYCATEEVLANPFTCDCGSPGCYRVVRGFRFLTADQRRLLEGELSPYLRKRFGLATS
jgi:SET domain-containing protein